MSSLVGAASREEDILASLEGVEEVAVEEGEEERLRVGAEDMEVWDETRKTQ